MESRTTKLGSGCNVSSCYHPSELLNQNYMNMKRSGEPARFLSYQNGSWVDFEKEVFDALKLGFTERRSVEIQVGGHDCIFDFYRMVQNDVVSWKRRSIAWIDVNGQPFFPKVFFDNEEVEGKGSTITDKPEDLKSPETECSSNKRKFVKVKNEEVGSSNLPATRRVDINNLWPNTKVLSPEEKLYKDARNMFLWALGIMNPKAKITRIHQWTINGPIEKARVEVFWKQLELTKKVRGDAKMVFAWYGGTASQVETVLSHGFRMPTNVHVSAAHGTGVYLTPVKFPHISTQFLQPDNNEERHVILCRVILGNCEKVEAGSNQSFPSSMEYNTGVDNLMDPKGYVVWVPNMNSHIIPECVVSFKRDDTYHWLLPSGNTLSPKLLTKLRSSIPPLKFKHLEVLCTSLKEGEMDRELFFNLLREMVGNDALCVAVGESMRWE